MMGFAAGQVVVQALIVCGLLYAVARHEADYSFQKVAMVMAGIALGQVVIYALMQQQPLWLVSICQIMFGAAMLATFCWITPAKSVLVILAFSLVQVAFQFAGEWVKQKYMNSGTIPSPVSEQDYADAKKFLEDSLGAPLEDGVAVSNEAPAAVAPEPASGKATASVASGTGDDAWQAARRQLRLSGQIRSGTNFAAVVNGKLCLPGTVVSAEWEGSVYRWAIRSVSQTRTELEPLDKMPVGR